MPMTNDPTLSVPALVIEIMSREYVDSGYMYSGGSHPSHIAHDCDVSVSAVLDALTALELQGKVERRSCASLSYQLAPALRWQLITDHDLSRVWEERAGFCYPNAEHGEVTSVCRAVGQHTGNR